MIDFINDNLRRLLELSAWTAIRPVPFSYLHLTACAAGLAVAIPAALSLARRPGSGARVLRIAGALLVVMEIYKQLFLTYIVCGGTYNYWYLPWQLCSIPMYLSFVFPGYSGPVRSRISRVFATFIADFGLLGGVMTLIWPDGIMYPYIALTLHGFIWHFMLIFLAVYAAHSGLADLSAGGFLCVIPLFAACSLIAFMINLSLGPAAGADMFYISPWHISNQPVFHMISAAVGIIPGICIYLISVLAGGFIAHRLLAVLFRR